MAPTNTAAWLVSHMSSPLEIKEAPYTKPGPDEVYVKNAAVAINIIDYKLQFANQFGPDFLNYPSILGQDVAGEVVEAGTETTRFKRGDRVLGHAMGMVSRRSADGAFQKYTILKEMYASAIPENISYKQAAVVPLTFSTAVCGLYPDSLLGLPWPSLDPKPTGKTLLVWGGSSGVGCSVIQLAVASGLEVITTASPKNFDLVRELGASQVFDYKSSSITDDLVEALKGKTLAGAYMSTQGEEELKIAISVLDQSQGTKNIASTNPRVNFAVPEGFRLGGIFGVVKDGSLAKAVYEDFLPQALKSGKYIPSPEAQVVGHGLEAVQGAIELVGKGVSAKKLVITL